ncbi:hypothetical protein NTGM5_440015 [Candidatus Nitrotoga sp. M5]|nr:hypothetical protein NTGM5_440015 [Candidatus Nitrotoga sp. M5]
MRTPAQKLSSTLKTVSSKFSIPSRRHFDRGREKRSNPYLYANENQAVMRSHNIANDSLEPIQEAMSVTPHASFDFSRISVHAMTPYGMSSDTNALLAGNHAKDCDHNDNMLYRDAVGAGPATAPAIVHEVLRSSGQPLPDDVRRGMEAQLGHNFADVHVHTDERADASAEAVAANAYTVGRHIVFAAGRFDPWSAQGRRLLTHELTHAASHPLGAPTPSGNLRISTPAESAERHAVAVSEGAVAPRVTPAAPPSLFRQASGLVGLAGLSINRNRVTVPPVTGLTFTATKSPANASGVTFAVVGDNATIAAGTTVDNTTGAITVAAGQTGGSAHIAATQNATAPNGATLTSTTPATAPFNFTAIPASITSTSASASSPSGFYGGDFTHTFTSPAGGQTALERSHVNEQFAGVSGTRLTITGPLSTLRITINNSNSASAGWDLNSSGTMSSPDHVTWSNTADARPFVANASHPTPSPTLPQALTATQNFRNLNFPGTYGATAVATTTHRRAIEDRNNLLKAVTSANASGINQEVVEDYAGPTVFRRCRAAPATIRVAGPTPPGGTAPTMETTTISVDTEGRAATPRFSIRPPNLNCTITPAGVLTPGTTAGTVTVRAGNATNFDETTVTLTPRPATFIHLTAVSSPTEIITANNLSQRSIDEAVLRRLNPEIQSSNTIASGTVIWLTARDVPARATSFEDIAERYFGNRNRWPTLWSFNPQIVNPETIQPTTRIHLQSEADRAQFGEIPLL